MQPVYLICGVAASGKSWICRQLKDKFHYVPHDQCWTHPTKKPSGNEHDEEWPKGAKSTHLQECVKAANGAMKPVITECPFGERLIREGLEACGIEVKPFFVVEEPGVIVQRYRSRQGIHPPANVYTRATTIEHRADEWAAPKGTSEELLRILTELAT